MSFTTLILAWIALTSLGIALIVAVEGALSRNERRRRATLVPLPACRGGEFPPPRRGACDEVRRAA